MNLQNSIKLHWYLCTANFEIARTTISLILILLGWTLFIFIVCIVTGTIQQVQVYRQHRREEIYVIRNDQHLEVSTSNPVSEYV